MSAARTPLGAPRTGEDPKAMEEGLDLTARYFNWLDTNGV
jgi:hypothetical protein